MKTFKIHISYLLTGVKFIKFRPELLKTISSTLQEGKYFGLCFNVFKFKNELFTINYDKSK